MYVSVCLSMGTSGHRPPMAFLVSWSWVSHPKGPSLYLVPWMRPFGLSLGHILQQRLCMARKSALAPVAHVGLSLRLQSSLVSSCDTGEVGPSLSSQHR